MGDGKDAPNYRGVSHKGRPRHRDQARWLLQQEQRLDLDEFQPCSALFALFVMKRPQSVSARCRMFSLPLPRSLQSCGALPFGCGERQETCV